MSQRVTLEHIARQSGVSLATVSLVLRDKPGINDETRRRVLETARTLGYTRRAGAGALPERGLQQVGVIMRARADDPPQTNRFYGPVLAGIDAACRRLQINLLLATVPVDLDNHPVELPRMLSEDTLDGLLLVGAFVDTTIAGLLRRRPTPVVLVDGYAEEIGHDSVVTENYRGAQVAVAHLLARGHRRIGIVASTPDAYPSIVDRRRGYLQALRDAGADQTYFADCPLSREHAYEAARELLLRSPEVTALFCCNDEAAFGAIQAAGELGRRVPEDLSVVGFDDIDLAAHIAPPLTTMHIDTVSMGRVAVQLLLNRVDWPVSAPVTAVLQPRLIERRSVAPPHS